MFPYCFIPVYDTPAQFSKADSWRESWIPLLINQYMFANAMDQCQITESLKKTEHNEFNDLCSLPMLVR